MIYNLSQQVDRQDFKEYCNQLYNIGKEKGCVVELKKIHRQRSMPQNKYLHFVLGLVASEIGLTLEGVKYDIFKKRVNPDLFERKRENRRGKTITFIRSTADLDTAELTQAIERFRNWSSLELGFYIPEPSEREAIIEAEKQIARYAEYI